MLRPLFVFINAFAEFTKAAMSLLQGLLWHIFAPIFRELLALFFLYKKNMKAIIQRLIMQTSSNFVLWSLSSLKNWNFFVFQYLDGHEINTSLQWFIFFKLIGYFRLCLNIGVVSRKFDLKKKSQQAKKQLYNTL